MYRMYINKVLFPVTPGKIMLKINNQNKTVTLINEGEVNLIKTPGLTDISIDELIIPMIQKYPFAQYKNGFKNASYYLGKLESWKKSKKPVQFKLIRISPNKKVILFDTTMDVTIEDYEIIEDAENNGLDIEVKLEMKQYRYWGRKKLVFAKGMMTDGGVVKKSKTRKTKSSAKTYVVKKNDTLLRIARRELGDESKRKKIYQLNKKVIEAAAKKHGFKSSSNGRRLFAGTKLKMPKATFVVGQITTSK